MTLSLTDSLPLNSTSSLASYNTVQPIPHVYGVCTVGVMPYAQDNRFHLIANHSIRSVDQVRIQDQPSKAYQLHNITDPSGLAIAVLELENSAESSDIAIDVHGKLNKAGVVITNPAELIYDLIHNVAGIEVDYSRLLDFRSQTAHIELGGVIDDSTSTLRNLITQILTSIGAVWTLGSPSIATLYPLFDRPMGTPLTSIPTRYIESLSSSLTLDSIFTVLKYEYDQDYYSNKPISTIELTSTTLQRYGERVKTISAPLVRNANSALSIATRLLQYYSTPVFKALLELDWDQEIAPMDWIDMTHPNLPASRTGEYFVWDSSSSVGSTVYDLTIESMIQSPPNVELTGQSNLFEFTQSELSYVYEDGVLTLTVVNTETGTPLKNASVTILGQEKFSDEKGVVKFKLDHGTFTVKITAPGFSSFTSEIAI